MITPAEAEALANKAIADYVTACGHCGAGVNPHDEDECWHCGADV